VAVLFVVVPFSLELQAVRSFTDSVSRSLVVLPLAAICLHHADVVLAAARSTSDVILQQVKRTGNEGFSGRTYANLFPANSKHMFNIKVNEISVVTDWPIC